MLRSGGLSRLKKEKIMSKPSEELANWRSSAKEGVYWRGALSEEALEEIASGAASSVKRLSEMRRLGSLIFRESLEQEMFLLEEARKSPLTRGERQKVAEAALTLAGFADV